MFLRLNELPNNGGVAQMVERSLSMREVPGSIPGASKEFFKPLSNKILGVVSKINAISIYRGPKICTYQIFLPICIVNIVLPQTVCVRTYI